VVEATDTGSVGNGRRVGGRDGGQVQLATSAAAGSGSGAAAGVVAGVVAAVVAGAAAAVGAGWRRWVSARVKVRWRERTRGSETGVDNVRRADKQVM
jgi:hypothetical protein